MNREADNRYLIITGGTIDYGFLEGYVRQERYDRLICVDLGLKAADDLGLKVDMIVGDFDTVPDSILNKYKAEGSSTIREFNPEKDATDTEIAIETAIQEGAGEITLLGATGTRVDHMLASISNLLIPLQYGIAARIVDEHNRIYLIDKPVQLARESVYGPYLSLIPFTWSVEGVTLTGMKYPLTGHTLVTGESLGISNEIVEHKGRISLTSGILIVIESKD